MIDITLLYSFHILDSTNICEGNKTNISCSEPLEIKFASYGRTSTNVCNNTTLPHSRTDCAGEVTAMVKNKCDGKNSCELYASNSVFGDTCPGTYKYLEVTFECKSGNITGANTIWSHFHIFYITKLLCTCSFILNTPFRP